MSESAHSGQFARHAAAKSYEPQGFEQEIYRFWKDQGCFDAADKNAEGQEAFSIVIPPPNVTGVLHMGHALTNTVQDILVRWHRMKGDNTLWLPGTDHAGIATQAQVEKQIAKEGKNAAGKPLSRHDMGREAFVKRVWKWKEDHGREITNQLQRLGSSLDWRRERFTMDEGLSAAVREVFCRLHEEGLIYRGERIINWCVRCQTALSDLEVIPTDRKGGFWHIAYRVVGSKESLTVATTRPETLLGDAAVAVHPDDERYRHLHGKKVVLPLLNREIPIIADPYVDKEFGSGALKITPAHDFNDYDLGVKHKLPLIQVMGKDARLTAEAGPYAGLKYVGGNPFSEARTKVIADLEASGLLLKTEPHQHKVGLCQRCDTVAEPIVSKQWFVKIGPLAKPAIEAVETGKIVFTPKNWEKTYFEWMRNIRDWCISRQLWWGHQIPAWYCSDCEHVTVARAAPAKCGGCGAPAAKLRQDEDVLDTWFSSALWPFSTLGWPEKTQALKTFYPTSILETGFDIIFFWVARMIMMGIHFMGEVPFRKVYLHAMVRDEKGEKMSKSKGNVIDPLELIGKHGADALRFTLASMAGQGRDIKLSADRVEGYRAFCNKLWNAVKFFQMQYEAAGSPPEPEGGTDRWLLARRLKLSVFNRWMLAMVERGRARVEGGLEAFELDESAKALYELAWHQLCDWHIEVSKLALKDTGEERLETLVTLHHSLETLLKLLHPFMPFVTEVLWQSLPWRSRGAAGKPDTLMLQAFPTMAPQFEDGESIRVVGVVHGIVEKLRAFRGENGISPKTPLPLRYVAGSAAAEAFMKTYLDEIQALARTEAIVSATREQVQGSAGEKDAVIAITNPPLELRIRLEGLVDAAEESKRIRKELDGVESDLAHVRGKLGRESFVAKAPPELVAAERAKEKELERKKADLGDALSRLGRLGSAGG